KGPCTQAGNTARLPVVVVIEAAYPTVTVDVRIEVDLMTRRTEIPGLAAHERLQESPPVGLRIHMHEKIVQCLHNLAGTGGQFGQRRIFKYEVTLSHCAFHSGERVAHHTSETGVRLRFVEKLTNRRVEHSAEEQRRIVAAGTPFRRLYTDD